ncbi:hypothetical protein B0H11DRAFT_1901343 [Mycena galericulata]|nr:hypothetical protein B0H11DRAFT_1918017 [Mycena galericulata]KAJ7509201.1 hypothetical protein B0H11DRAFT_1901343 [Mycena galericulata]
MPRRVRVITVMATTLTFYHEFGFCFANFGSFGQPAALPNSFKDLIKFTHALMSQILEAILTIFWGLQRNGSDIISSWATQSLPAWQTSAKLEKQGRIGAWE